jgi:hypothetical protein
VAKHGFLKNVGWVVDAKIVMVTTFILLAGCAPKPNSIGAACWADNTKAEVKQSSLQIAQDEIFDEYEKAAIGKGTMKRGDEIPQAKKDAISKNLSIEMHDFFVLSGDMQSGHYECGVNGKFSYLFGDHALRLSSDDQIINFEVVQSEKGQNVLTRTMPIQQMIQSIGEKLPPLNDR